MDADFLDYDDLEEDDFGDYGDDIETGDEPGYDDFDASGRILMVAEKNSIAEAIAKALSNTVRTKKNRNVVLYFTAPF
jgi:hypothetical protein